MTTDSTPEPAADPIGRELMRHAQLVSDLRRDLDDLTSTITDLAADLVSRLEELREEGPNRTQVRSWCWRDIGPEAQEQLWVELRDWVDWLRGRYPIAKHLPTCWTQHPEVVEEMTALWLAWQSAYAEPDAPMTAAIDWHDRWLPGVLHRLQQGPNALNCANRHESRPSSAYAQTSAAER